MKKLFFLFAIALLSFSMNAQEIKWMTFNEAVAAQKKEAKPIFMDAFTDWCGPCKMLDKNTFTDSKVIEHINKNYYAVKFDSEGNEEISYKGKKYTNPGYNSNRKGRNATHDFTMFLRIPGYPSMVIFDAKGEVTNVIVGYKTPQQLLEQL
ncbi:thioredoxin family protein [Myroides phaeus]|uniref:Thioredoxin-like n=1 Tax=Myroides phaeus TaxID=702745 RepID=A0A1G8BEV0_9FLAO|nr:thioredoxin fold domain-containing protein [Myroides phaeus]MEC4117001.1 thioredoxin fold domain-containing protein [Myroides phaeus]SDH31110.1 Thioredoxin-like [Myroides phaeus]